MAGHYFDYDPVKLERLRELTAELRLGMKRNDNDCGMDEHHENYDLA